MLFGFTVIFYSDSQNELSHRIIDIFLIWKMLYF